MVSRLFGNALAARGIRPAFRSLVGGMVFVCVTAAFVGHGGGRSASAESGYPASSNPTPSISSVSPASTTAGGAAFTLTLNGSGFLRSSIVQWNGNDRSTRYISATQLSIIVRASDIGTGQYAAITVTNAPPGGGVSPEASFSVKAPAPSVASLSPSATAAGGDAFKLTVEGKGFLPASTVRWNAAYGQPPLATTYVSPTKLTVSIPANDIAFAGDANVTVVNRSPGGGTSAAAVFRITGSIPANVSFVAPSGNDDNSGTITQPYRTIQMCATTVSSGDICAIRAGTYRETVRPHSGITITSFDGEPVTVDGSDPVTGWTHYHGSIYKAKVALGANGANQVFDGNQMMTEARWPNGNDLFHVNWATLGTGTTTTRVVDPKLPNIDWEGATVTFWSGPDPNSFETGTVRSSQAGNLAYSLDSVPQCAQNGSPYGVLVCPTPGGYYYLTGVLGALDTQDEWFFDSTADVLYLWAPGGGNPNGLSVRAKQRQYAFDLSGQSEVTIEHLNIFASTINTDSASNNDVIDGIDASYVSHSTILKDYPGYPATFKFAQTLNTGIVLMGSGNILENSTIAFSAGDGVALQGRNNTVRNNLIHDVDYMGTEASGLYLTGTGHKVQNNTIYATGRIAIRPDSGSGPTNDLDIGYNNLFNTMMFSRDAGAFYTYGDAVTGGKVHNNWFHDSQPLPAPPGTNPYLPISGIYFDDYSTGWMADQNILWNNEPYDIFLNESAIPTGSPQPPAENIHIVNNTLPDVNDEGYILLNDIMRCGTTQIADNLVLVPVQQTGATWGVPTTTPCSAANNRSSAPGATQMASSVQVGCNFAGCSSEGPPKISGSSVAASIAVQPYSITVALGQPVTFTVRGSGSPTLTYQWRRNGSEITGATNASYALSATRSADNGAVFTVTVRNSLGSVTSVPAVLTLH